ncbi:MULTISPECIES: Hsp20/alpha crystallin family protein [Glycomyces]|jgi:HSP20 family protein|uniref:Hsp20/alpha crystallin family protein n=1 Tax=Glycomyces niveus TaxID=2820287 RepID=A0ABS3U2Q4_9ACTN|nr:Hsp20/alpha crystallin family protein [Glycomyces sp. NEAU-S30]MBO3733050.1 Hsp20/alpha crystallin family protein [Glycomyces sp. NEAU-S30]
MLVRSDPFRDIDRIAQQMLGLNDSQLSMPMDAWKEGHTFNIQIDLPGVREGDIDLEVERNVLTVRAERRAVEAGDREIIHAERRTGSFARQILLSDALDTEQVEATYRDGVLTLRIPMAEQAKPRKVLIGAGAKEIEQ